jgi:hypothetical protein
MYAQLVMLMHQNGMPRTVSVPARKCRTGPSARGQRDISAASQAPRLRPFAQQGMPCIDHGLLDQNV